MEQNYIETSLIFSVKILSLHSASMLFPSIKGGIVKFLLPDPWD